MTIRGYLRRKKSLADKASSTLRLLQVGFEISKNSQRKMEQNYIPGRDITGTVCHKIVPTHG
jgi:hypothetical protein